MKISLIGNCQAKCYAYYLSMLLPESEIFWIPYSDSISWDWERSEFGVDHVDHEEGEDRIRKSDFVIYQSLKKTTSEFFNECCIREYACVSAKLISIPNISFDTEGDYEVELEKLKKREQLQNLMIKSYPIFRNSKGKELMISYRHPTTFVQLYVLREICKEADFDFFDEQTYSSMVLDANYIRLPKGRMLSCILKNSKNLGNDI